MLSFLLKTTGQVLINAAINNQNFQAKVKETYKKSVNKFRKPRKPKLTLSQLQEQLRDVEGWVTDTNQRLDEMEHYNADYFKSMRNTIPAEVHDPETGEVLESDDSQREQDFRSTEEAHWAKVRNG
jgi:predicted transcriptional regulator